MANAIQKANNSLATKKDEPQLSRYLAQESVRLGIENSIGKSKSADFIANVLACSAANPIIKKCDYKTVVSSALMATSLELPLSPQLGYVYLVPFEDNKNDRTVATFIMGYKGYIQLAIRSGQYRKINVFAIKEGELKNWNPATEDIDIQVEDYDGRENAETIGYCARLELVNGFVKTMYWSKAKMQAHARKYSRGYENDLRKGTSYTYWSKDFDGMAMKTMLRQIISKWGIMSIKMQQAYEADSADEINGQGFVSFDDEDGAEANTVALDFNNEAGVDVDTLDVCGGGASVDVGSDADSIFGKAKK